MGACECAAAQVNAQNEIDAKEQHKQLTFLTIESNASQISSILFNEKDKHQLSNSSNQKQRITHAPIPAFPCQLQLDILQEFRLKVQAYGNLENQPENIQNVQGEDQLKNVSIKESMCKLGLKETYELKKIILKIKERIDQLHLPQGYVEWPQQIFNQFDKIEKITLNKQKTESNPLSYKYTVKKIQSASKKKIGVSTSSIIVYQFSENLSFQQSSTTQSVVFYLHPSKDYYYGEIKDGKANGYGEYVHFEGTKYKGQWRKDQMDGAGRQEWVDGAWFEGLMKKGDKAWGTFYYPNGSFYQGEFHKGKFHGIGLYSYPIEQKIKIQNSNNKILQYKSVNQTKSNFQSYASDNAQKIQLSQSKKETYLQSRIKNLSNRYYVGHFENSMMNGTGVFHWPSSQHFCGSYHNDKKEGDGILRLQDGTLIKGRWAQGKIQGEIDIWRNGVHKIISSQRLMREINISA